MDDFVRQKLVQWKMEKYIFNFQEHEIDEEAFHLLDEAAIAGLIPKHGPRLKFSSFYDQYKFTQNAAVMDSISAVETIDKNRNGADFTIVNVSGNACRTTSDIYNFHKIASVSKKDHSSRINTQKRKGAEMHSDEASKKKRSIFPNGLRALLESSPDGEYVLRNRGSMNEALRRKLAKCIVDHLLWKDLAERSDNGSGKPTLKFHLDSMFTRAAEEIVEEFPLELKETYYVPYKPRTKSAPKSGARGKLYSMYTRYNAMMRKEDLDASTRRVIVDDNDDSHDIIDDSQGNDEESAEMSISLDFVRNNLKPFEDVLEAWKTCYSLRQNYLKHKEKIEDYFTEFPVLSTQSGWQLLTSDFEVLYPNKTDTIYAVWRNISSKLLQVGLRRKVIPVSEANLNSDAVMLMYLPLLFPVMSINKRDRPTWRPSKVEMQGSFFLHLKNMEDIDQKLQEREKRLLQMKDGMEPFILAVGKNLCDLQAIYVVVNNTKYFMESVLKALDVCFKSFFALNIDYPPEAQQIWTFIQTHIYGIHKPQDKSFTGVTTLIADVRQIQAN